MVSPIGNFTHPINAVIWYQRANGVFPRSDKIKRVIGKDTKVSFHFWKDDIEAPIVGYENVYGFGKDALITLYCPQRGVYIPTDLVVDKTLKAQFKIDSRAEGAKIWRINAHRDRMVRWNKETFWQKYMMPLTIVFMGVAIMLALYQFTKFQEVSGNQMVAMADSLKQIVQMNKDTVQIMVDAGRSGSIIR